MENIIQQLKDNKRPLILMNSELQNAMLSMHPKEFICLQDTSALNDHQWKAVDADKWHIPENLYNVFRLRPDYEEEPEIVECEIYTDNYTALAYGPTGKPLDLAFRDPDFIGFKFENGQVELSPIVFKGSCSTKSICQFRDLVDLEVLHASHVLFRRNKP